VLRLHAAGLALSFIAAGLSYVALSLHRHRAILRASLAALAANAALTVIGANVAGAEGAAATVVAELVVLAGLALAVAGAGVPIAVDRRALAVLTASAAAGVALAVLVPAAARVQAGVALAIWSSPGLRSPAGLRPSAAGRMGRNAEDEAAYEEQFRREAVELVRQGQLDPGRRGEPGGVAAIAAQLGQAGRDRPARTR
jgi:hypothetical protein